MSRRATREAHAKVVSRHREPEGAGPGCAIPALLLLLAITSCVHGPSAQDQADLQLVAVAVEQAGACVPQEQAQQARAALGRLGVSLSAQAQARAIWEAAGQVFGAVWPWVLEQVARPPP